MLTLQVVPIESNEGKMDGFIYSDEELEYILLPKKTKVFSKKTGEVYELSTWRVKLKSGLMYKTRTREEALRTIKGVLESEVQTEPLDDWSNRLKSSKGKVKVVPQDWINTLVARNKPFDLAGETPQSRYAKTPRGKATMEKWRNSEKGQGTLELKKEEKKEFREASKWIANHPGSTFEDWLKSKEEK